MILNYKLIGTMPELDKYREQLPMLIAEYEAGELQARQFKEKLAAASADGDLMKVLTAEALKDPTAIRRMAVGVLIEMCAEHFYGIEVCTTYSMAELIDTIRSLDQDLEFK